MRVEIDIHGYVEYDALKILEKFIASQSSEVTEIVVIHGFHKGNVLQEMVRDKNKLRSKRIYRRKVSSNQGETILELY